ncbi:MAG: hypothetical protein KAR20_04155 [Candidatus Heimdallarchaeota archaeon]|nr:hypothetical protein [Candidatus Heimdallarchaeota archaeon]
MYNCSKCGATSKIGEKANRVQVLRPAEYTNYKLEFDPKTKRKNKVEFKTTGFEIERELIQCAKCFQGSIDA